MKLELSKDQIWLVHKALEGYQRDLREQIKKVDRDVVDRIEPDLFQLELLITWFDRQREMSS